MSEQAIYNSTQEEITNHLLARHKRNGGTINMMNIINEATYCLAVNVIKSRRMIKKQSGGQMEEVPSETLQIMFTAIKHALENSFPENFNDEYFDMIKNKYEKLMDDDLLEDKVNKHYDELYQEGDVI